MAAIKSKLDSALLLLDEIQLNELGCDLPSYVSINAVKEELEGGKDLVNGRFNLISKVDASKVGWPAVPHYEKINGYLVNSDSAKNWEVAEKKVAENRKASSKDDKKPFRRWPAGNGRSEFQNYPKSNSRGELSLCFSTASLSLLSYF